MAVPGRNLTATAALLAIVALLVGVFAAGSASADPVAGAAKKAKKCKKAKKSASSAKKKKCKKKKQTTPPPAAPVVRATITWANADADDADLDLYAFDASGNIARPTGNAIPQTALSADVTGKNGTETFTDNAPSQKREFSFGVCYTVGGSAHAPFTLTYVTADGVTHTEQRDPGSSFHYEFPTGPAIPATYCP